MSILRTDDSSIDKVYAAETESSAGLRDAQLKVNEWFKKLPKTGVFGKYYQVGRTDRTVTAKTIDSFEYIMTDNGVMKVDDCSLSQSDEGVVISFEGVKPCEPEDAPDQHAFLAAMEVRDRFFEKVSDEMKAKEANAKVAEIVTSTGELRKNESSLLPLGFGSTTTTATTKKPVPVARKVLESDDALAKELLEKARKELVFESVGPQLKQVKVALNTVLEEEEDDKEDSGDNEDDKDNDSAEDKDDAEDIDDGDGGSSDDDVVYPQSSDKFRKPEEVRKEIEDIDLVLADVQKQKKKKTQLKKATSGSRQKQKLEKDLKALRNKNNTLIETKNTLKSELEQAIKFVEKGQKRTSRAKQTKEVDTRTLEEKRASKKNFVDNYLAAEDEETKELLMNDKVDIKVKVDNGSVPLPVWREMREARKKEKAASEKSPKATGPFGFNTLVMNSKEPKKEETASAGSDVLSALKSRKELRVPVEPSSPQEEEDAEESLYEDAVEVPGGVEEVEMGIEGKYWGLSPMSFRPSTSASGKKNNKGKGKGKKKKERIILSESESEEDGSRDDDDSGTEMSFEGEQRTSDKQKKRDAYNLYRGLGRTGVLNQIEYGSLLLIQCLCHFYRRTLGGIVSLQIKSSPRTELEVQKSIFCHLILGMFSWAFRMVGQLGNAVSPSHELVAYVSLDHMTTSEKNLFHRVVTYLRAKYNYVNSGASGRGANTASVDPEVRRGQEQMVQTFNSAFDVFTATKEWPFSIFDPRTVRSNKFNAVKKSNLLYLESHLFNSYPGYKTDPDNIMRTKLFICSVATGMKEVMVRQFELRNRQQSEASNGASTGLGPRRYRVNHKDRLCTSSIGLFLLSGGDFHTMHRIIAEIRGTKAVVTKDVKEKFINKFYRLLSDEFRAVMDAMFDVGSVIDLRRPPLKYTRQGLFNDLQLIAGVPTITNQLPLGIDSIKYCMQVAAADEKLGFVFDKKHAILDAKADKQSKVEGIIVNGMNGLNAFSSYHSCLGNVWYELAKSAKPPDNMKPPAHGFCTWKTNPFQVLDIVEQMSPRSDSELDEFKQLNNDLLNAMSECHEKTFPFVVKKSIFRKEQGKMGVKVPFEPMDVEDPVAILRGEERFQVSQGKQSEFDGLLAEYRERFGRF